MFILGGEEKGKYLGQAFSYNFVTLAFVQCSNMLESKSNFGAIYFKNCIFIVGGWREFFSRKCQMFQINSNQKDTVNNLLSEEHQEVGKWTEISPLNTEREGISLCIVQDRWLYAFGNVITRGKRFKIVGGGLINDGAQNLSKQSSMQ